MEASTGSARRKQQVVLRLLRGEGLDALARETGQAAGTLSAWREDFLQPGLRA
jgi:transposase